MARSNRYTSYLGVNIEEKAASTLSQYEKLIEDTYARIDRYASRAMSQGGVAPAFNARARSDIAATNRELTTATTTLDRTGTAARRTAQETNLLATSFFRAGQSLNVVQGPLGPLAGRLGALGSIFRDLAGFSLAAVLGGGGAFALGSIATQYQKVTDRLRPYYDTQKQANAALEEVVGIAQRTRQALDPVASLYNRIQQAGKANGVKQNLGALTETVAKAARLSGGDEQAQSAGLTQFAQGFGSGTLGGDELKSIRENTFRLAKALADGLGVPIAQLKALGAAGKLTPQVIAEALARSADQIDMEFSRLPVRIGQALTLAGNNLSLFVGKLDSATGATGGLAKAILAIGNNIPGVITAAGGLAAALSARALVNQFRTVEMVIDGVAVKQTGAVARMGQFIALQKQRLADEIAFNTAAREGTLVVLGSAEAEAQRAAFTRDATAAQYESALAQRASGEAARAQLKTQLALIAQQREAAIAGRVSAEEAETSAAAAGAAERVAILKAELNERAALQVAAEEQRAALIRGGSLVQRNPDLSDARRASLLATNSAAATEAQLALAKAELLVISTSKKLAAAEAELAAVLSGDLATSNAVIIEQNSIIATTTAARIRTEQALVAVETELAAVNARIVPLFAAVAVSEAVAGEAAAAAAVEVTALSAAMVVATAVGKAFQGALTTVTSFLGGPFGIALIAATAGALYFGTKVDEAKDAAERFSQAQDALAEKLGGTAGAFDKAARSAAAFRVELLRSKVVEADRNRDAARTSLSDSLEAAAIRFNPITQGGQIGQVRELASRVRTGGRYTLEEIQRLRDKNPDQFASNSIARFLGSDPGDAGLKAVGVRQTAIEAAQARADLAKATSKAAEVKALPPILGTGSSTTKAEIDAAIKAKLATTDLQKAKAALAQVQAEADKAMKTGGVAAYAEYADKITEAKRAVMQATDAEKAGRAAKSAGAKATREKTAAVKDQISRENELQSILQRYSGESSAYNQGQNAISKIEQLFQKVLPGGKIAQIPTITIEGEAITKAEAIAAVVRGMNKPYNDLVESQSREIAIQKLRLAGLGDEADLAQKRADLEKTLSRELLPAEVDKLREQQVELEKINDKITARNRLIDIYANAIGGVQNAFRDAVAGALNGDGDVVKKFGAALKAAYINAVADKITVSIFGDAQQKFRDDMTRGLNGSAGRLTGSAEKLDAAAQALIGAARGAPGAGTLGTAATGTSATPPVLDPGIKDLLGDTAVTLGGKVADSVEEGIQDIVVVGKRQKNSGLVESGETPKSVSEALDKLGINLGIKNFGPNSPITKLLGKLGTVLEGAVAGGAAGSIIGGKTGQAIGTVVGGAISGISAVLKTAGKSGGKLGTALGSISGGLEGYTAGQAIGAPIGQAISGNKGDTGNKIGGAVGGAAGFIFGGPIGAAIGSAIGSIIGGVGDALFGKTPRGNATITGLGAGGLNVSGTDAGHQSQATELGQSVQSGLKQISDALGGALGAFNVSIGTFNDKYRVSTTGYTGSLDSKHASGLVDFGKDGQAEAIQFAIVTAIQQGAVKGIRQGALNLLKAGKDLTAQLDKATKFQQVFTDLKAYTDPTGAAIDALNTKFENLIDIFNEAGASTQDFADLQKLYDFQRADAIKNATNDSVATLQNFIDGLKNTSASPLNKRTVYQNAAAAVAGFRSDISSGKAVDQDKLVTALQNFEDASKGLNGSGSAFFRDFDDILALAEKAKANASTGSSATTLPASPFGGGTAPTPGQSTMVTDQAAATAILNQTATLAAYLQKIADNTSKNAAADAASALSLLPGGFSSSKAA